MPLARSNLGVVDCGGLAIVVYRNLDEADVVGLVLAEMSPVQALQMRTEALARKLRCQGPQAEASGAF